MLLVPGTPRMFLATNEQSQIIILNLPFKSVFVPSDNLTLSYVHFQSSSLLLLIKTLATPPYCSCHMPS